ncbi:SDR family oxidoreductase [Chlorobium ferrooxidans]|uniref:NAD-dependent epimerase/dehydratase:3-beta hydroxysteroid dehydrogenase/isomerase:NmrA-like n=1 Tax=Chlorobium ferrooxidans DSM 13031 TaxID=377431 RepID=Q0YTK8_9CHLB|nr:SDR family oxidoreductase [Chlorobium ferrooxidans]EAT59546.1 NAD-dependent epimerase/dehydratase:3-beta hydroxysteroid dehydrogenase/isomerase:NmrA-like [Chlorobium ferrooxidans DSM 13031]
MNSENSYNGRVLVAGGTGRTGQWVVKRLLHYGVPVRVFCRDRDKAVSLFGDRVECVSGVIQSATDIAVAVKGCSAVISALGSGSYSGESSPAEVDRDGVMRLVDEAANAGVKHFALVSSMAVTKWYHPLNLFAGVLLKKWEAEEHVRKVFSGSDRSFTIVRPGGLKDGEPLRHRLHVDTGDRLWSGWINRSDVAELLVLSLWVEKAKNKTFEVINEVEENQQSLEPFYSMIPE